MTAPAVTATTTAGAGRTPRRPFGGRAGPALVVGALSSTGNLALSVAVAHTSTITQLGQFVVAFAAYAFGTGLARATVTESILATPEHLRDSAAGSRRVCLVGWLAAVLTCAGGLVVGSPFLLLLGVLLPGLVLYDYVKVLSLATARPRDAVVQECLTAALTLAGVAAGLFYFADPLVVFGAWAVASALVGYLAAVFHRYRPLPSWRLTRADTRQAVSFGAQFVVASGSAQLALVGISAVAGTAVVGALGAARTVLGPVTLIVSTATTLVIPRLAAHASAAPAARLGAAVRTAALAAAFVVPVAVLCIVLPDRAGRLLVGENWAAAGPLVAILAVESLLALVSMVAFAGHRVERAGTRALLLGTTMGVVRVVGLTGAAVVLGARGVALTMVVLAGCTVATWWFSYALLLRSRTARRTRSMMTSTSASVRSG